MSQRILPSSPPSPLRTIVHITRRRASLAAAYLTRIACVAIVGTLLSCATTPRTTSSLTPELLSQIRKTAILVESTHSISVRVAREQVRKPSFWEFFAFGNAAGLFYQGNYMVAARADSTYEEELGRVLGNFDLENESAIALHHEFSAGNVFPIVEIVQTGDINRLMRQGFDVVFKLKIREWGLGFCSGVENGQVQLDIIARLVTLKDDLTVWEHNELFKYHLCRPVSDFAISGEMLRADLKQATETLAGKLANEIAFPESL
jgi:hypothetical protein